MIAFLLTPKQMILSTNVNVVDSKSKVTLSKPSEHKIKDKTAFDLSCVCAYKCFLATAVTGTKISLQ